MLPATHTWDSKSSPFPPLVPSFPTNPSLNPQQGYAVNSPQRIIPPFCTTNFCHSPQLPPAIYSPQQPSAALQNDLAPFLQQWPKLARSCESCRSLAFSNICRFRRMQNGRTCLLQIELVEFLWSDHYRPLAASIRLPEPYLLPVA